MSPILCPRTVIEQKGQADRQRIERDAVSTARSALVTAQGDVCNMAAEFCRWVQFIYIYIDVFAIVATEIAEDESMLGVISSSPCCLIALISLMRHFRLDKHLTEDLLW